MIEGSLITIIVFAWLFLRWASANEERQQLLELAERTGVPLDERRAARAVATGHAGWLRQRLERQAAASEQTPADRAPSRTEQRSRR